MDRHRLLVAGVPDGAAIDLLLQPRRQVMGYVPLHQGKGRGLDGAA